MFIKFSRIHLAYFKEPILKVDNIKKFITKFEIKYITRKEVSTDK